MIQIAFIIITIIANKRGLTDSAAVGIVEKVISFLFLVPSSMLSTVSALGAQNIGAGKPERAKLTLRYAIFITAGFGLIVAIIIQFIAEPVVGLFTTDNGVFSQEVNIFAATYRTACLPVFTLASAVISVHARSRFFPSFTILSPSHWYVFLVYT